VIEPTPRIQDGFLCDLVQNLRGATVNCYAFDFLIDCDASLFTHNFPELPTY
jgi:hypothetical protein